MSRVGAARRDVAIEVPAAFHVVGRDLLAGVVGRVLELGHLGLDRLGWELVGGLLGRVDAGASNQRCPDGCRTVPSP
jgi:hypothetical protein